MQVLHTLATTCLYKISVPATVLIILREEFMKLSAPLLQASNSPGMLSWHGFCATGNSHALQVSLSPAQLQTGSLEVTKLLYVWL